MKIYQIYHNKEQREGLLHTPFYNPVPNTADWRYLFFESAVIEKVVKHDMHLGHDYAGVLAPKFKQKIEQTRSWGINIRHKGNMMPYTHEHLSNFCKQNGDADIIRLTNNPPHSTFGFSEQFHNGMLAIARDMMKHLGIPYNVSKPQRSVIYFNFFLARPEILQDYVDNWLTPAIDFLLNDERAYKNSGYIKDFPVNLCKIYGIEHYPFFPFITERLISVYLDWNKKLKIKIYR